jgi:hypothetical protein
VTIAFEGHQLLLAGTSLGATEGSIDRVTGDVEADVATFDPKTHKQISKHPTRLSADQLSACSNRIIGTLLMLPCTRRKPSLPRDVMKEFDQHGADALRGLLVGSSDGYSGTMRTVNIRLGNATVTRGQIEDWLKWKAAKGECWMMVGVVAAAAAAIFSFLALIR